MKNRRQFWLQALASGTGLLCSANNVTAQLTSSEEEVPVTGRGPTNPLLSSIDESIQEFLKNHAIPGAAVAIGRAGKLLYSKGFGLQRRGHSQLVQPNSLFRIASVSKPITAIAVLQLIERAQLTLRDSVFKLLDLREPQDPRWKQITVEQLLRHTAGFDRDKSFDPMFHFRQVAKARNIPFPISHQDLIDYMLDRDLDHDPGSHYAYSNFGYCLLGRLIERISGKSYEQFVQHSVWSPISVTEAIIGRSLIHQRHESEVYYHDASERTGTPVVDTDEKLVPYPYGVWDITAMDSHGGWVCSAPDLVRLASDFDASSPKLLSTESSQVMFSVNKGLTAKGQVTNGVGYGLGWQIRNRGSNGYNAWHTGRLDGTAALLVRRHDGFNWAALFNTHLTKDGKYIIELFDPKMHTFVDQVKRWPTVDLFS